MVIENKILEKISIQIACMLLEKAMLLVGSNYKSHNLTAI